MKKLIVNETKAAKAYLHNNILCLEHKRTGHIDYFTPNNALIQLFGKYTVSLEMDRYTRGLIYIGGDRKRYTVHELAMASYLGILRQDDVFASMEDYRRARGDGVTVDHLDGIKTNNTLYNLSWMNVTHNTRKQDVVSRLQLPHGVALAYYNGLYLAGMLWTKVNNTVPDLLATYGITAGRRGVIACMYFVCNTIP